VYVCSGNLGRETLVEFVRDTTLGPQTRRKVGGGSGSITAFASQVSVTSGFVFYEIVVYTTHYS